MKKVKLICAIGSFLFIGMSFTACDSVTTGDQDVTTQEQSESVVKDEYKCPMDCEDGKVYDEPGSCPVCKMDLKKVEPKTED